MGKKRIGTILGWIISILLLFTGIVCLFQNFLTGIFFLLAGLILLPPLYRAVKKKLPIRTWQKAAALAACLALAIAFMPKQIQRWPLCPEGRFKARPRLPKVCAPAHPHP